MKNAATLCAASHRVASLRATVCDRVCLGRTFVCTFACSYSKSYRTCSFVYVFLLSFVRSFALSTTYSFRFFARSFARSRFRSRSSRRSRIPLPIGVHREIHTLCLLQRADARKGVAITDRVHAITPVSRFLRRDASSSKLVPVPLRPRVLVPNPVVVCPPLARPSSTESSSSSSSSSSRRHSLCFSVMYYV